MPIACNKIEPVIEDDLNPADAQSQLDVRGWWLKREDSVKHTWACLLPTVTK
jgi:hypothetical protein